ncbi:MAG: tetratricopeptide repeat protein, partial [Actinomycetota bacterium]|nr:tetratricopeptide repeat protein [Actinomycetota bacterium]
TSRNRELSVLEEWAGEASERLVLAVITGTAGVGKTMLALRWLYQAREQFPDGQLYVDLGGFSSSGPVRPEDVLEWFLVALGLPTTRIPDGLPQRVALYRSMTARRGMSVLLDNALSAAQVRALLPSSPRCVVIVTSRHRLSGLRVNGARFLDLDPLDLEDSVTLLENVIGDRRAETEHREARELARLCGGLPIALSVVGARLSSRPHRTLSREVAAIRDKDRLAALDMNEDVSVSGIFDTSYETLPPGEARLYRLCSLHPGPVFGLEVAAAITGMSQAETEEAVDALVERSLLTEVDDRRYRYHDLLHLHARQLAEREDDEETRVVCTRRMVEWYLDHAAAADHAIRPTRRRVGPRFRTEPKRVFADSRDAIRWMFRERRNLSLAVETAEEHRWDDLVWELCEALWGLVSYAPGDWSSLYKKGAEAALRCGHEVAETRMRILLGSTLTVRRRYDEAIEEITRALRKAEATGNRFSTATALIELASAMQGKGELQPALDQLREAKSIREAVDTPRSVAQCRRQIGVLLGELGRYEEAVEELSQTLDAVPASDIERSRVLVALGTAHHRSGERRLAEVTLTEALGIATELGSDLRRADALTALGELAADGADTAAAKQHLTAARDLYEGLGNPLADDLTARLAALGDP